MKVSFPNSGFEIRKKQTIKLLNQIAAGVKNGKASLIECSGDVLDMGGANVVLRFNVPRLEIDG